MSKLLLLVISYLHGSELIFQDLILPEQPVPKLLLLILCVCYFPVGQEEMLTFSIVSNRFEFSAIGKTCKVLKLTLAILTILCSPLPSTLLFKKPITSFLILITK